MKAIDPWNLPDEVELVLAYRLLAQRQGLDRRILYDLLGQPKRYAELRRLLAGKRDHNLTVALKRLRENGLVDQRMDARREPVVHTYGITELGILVVLAMQSVRPVQESVALYERGRARAES